MLRFHKRKGHPETVILLLFGIAFGLIQAMQTTGNLQGNMWYSNRHLANPAPCRVQDVSTPRTCGTVVT